MGNDSPEVLIEITAGFRLEDGTDSLETGEKARITVDGESLRISYSLGGALFFPLRDIDRIEAAHYNIILDMASGEKLVLYHLGYRYDDFCRILNSARNELSINDFLMQERIIKEDIRSSYIRYSAAGDRLEEGKCRVRLYETAMVIIPQSGKIARLIYSFMDRLLQDDYSLNITMDTGEKWRLEKLGREYRPLVTSLSDVLSSLSLKTQEHLRQLLPEASLSVIRKAAELLKDGRAAKKTDLENIFPGLWVKLEERLEIAGVKDEYDFLSALSDKEQVCIGFKRGLLGDLTGEYIWFLIPIYSPDPGMPGNVVAMEASGDGGGKATYFFRIMDRKEYRQNRDKSELADKTGEFLIQLNRCMLEINFRREPIYLTDDKIKEPSYSRYKESIRQISHLQTLRKHFVGRVIHGSSEQWEKDVLDLMQFNINAKDNGEKWSKSLSRE